MSNRVEELLWVIDLMAANGSQLAAWYGPFWERGHQIQSGELAEGNRGPHRRAANLEF